MKYSIALSIELENDKRCTIVMDADFTDDWNTLKDAKALLENWAQEQDKREYKQ